MEESQDKFVGVDLRDQVEVEGVYGVDHVYDGTAHVGQVVPPVEPVLQDVQA